MRRGIGKLRAGGGIWPTNNTVDLFIVVGQSNAEGRGTSSQSPAAYNGMYISGSTITPPPLLDPVGGATTGSMWPAFSNEWARLTGHKSAFVEAAQGGTGLLVSGSGVVGSGEWGSSGTLRAAAVTACNSATTAINSSSYTLGSVYFLWSQGEQEAAYYNGTTVSGSAYNTALQALADYFKAQVPSMVKMGVIQTGSVDELEFGAAVMSALDVNQQSIRRAQADACASDANLAMLYRGAGSFIGQRLMKDSVHYSQVGLNMAGKCAARELASPAGAAGAISPYISSTNYPAPSWSPGTTRSASHTTASGTTMLIVAVMSEREANQFYTTDVTFGGVPMRALAVQNSKSATPASVMLSLYYLDASIYGSSLSGITATIAVTTGLNASFIDWCAIHAKDVEVVDSETGFATTASASGSANLNTYQPTLVVSVFGSAAISASALTATLSNSTEVMDHGLASGGRSAQFAVGYSSEASACVDKAIGCTWSASCTELAGITVAFRQRLSGEQ